MTSSMILFAFLLIVPFIEIGLLIAVGGQIGILPTLLLCIATAIAGAVLVRNQGIQTFVAAHRALDRGEMPLAALFDGLCIGIAGALLMTPGFFTDGLGFSLLIPQVRSFLRRYVASRLTAGAAAGSIFTADRGAEGIIIEGEYETIDPASIAREERTDKP